MIQQHPMYQLGFQEAAQGVPLYDDCYTEYKAGWWALHDARAILDRLDKEPK